jgi:hypothetical protein
MSTDSSSSPADWPRSWAAPRASSAVAQTSSVSRSSQAPVPLPRKPSTERTTRR